MKATASPFAAIFGTRLRQARVMSGYSLRELSQQLGEKGVSHAALQKYEKGVMMPDSGLLATLSKVLHQKPDFFFRRETVRLSALSFRKRTRLTKSAEQAIQARALDYVERYLEVESFVAAPAAESLPSWSVSTPEEAEEAANRLRELWKLGAQPLPKVLETLEDAGIKVCIVEAPDAFDGFAGAADGIPVITLARWLESDTVRLRFTALHELAHLVLHIPPNTSAKMEEAICHRFAGALLLPAAKLKAELGESRKHLTLKEMLSLKAEYGISLAAAMRRAYDLGVLSQTNYRQFQIIYKRSGWHRKEPGTYEGSEETRRFCQLVLRAAGEELISQTKASALLNVPLSALKLQPIS